jgi:hypothetical protein
MFHRHFLCSVSDYEICISVAVLGSASSPIPWSLQPIHRTVCEGLYSGTMAMSATMGQWCWGDAVNSLILFIRANFVLKIIKLEKSTSFLLPKNYDYFFTTIIITVINTVLIDTYLLTWICTVFDLKFNSSRPCDRGKLLLANLLRQPLIHIVMADLNMK